MSDASELNCSIARTFESSEVDREEWDQAVAELGGSVYQTYDWLRTWWRYYGWGRELRIFVFRVGRRVVALIPVYIDTVGLWPLRFKTARLVGSNIPPKVFDPPVDPDWAGRCFEMLVRALMIGERCDLLNVGPVSSAFRPWNDLGQVANQLAALVSCRLGSADVHTVFWLPEELEDYCDVLGKSERKRRDYEFRALKKSYSIRVEVIADASAEQLLEEFDRFAAQHTRQWELEGKPGHFGAWPDGFPYNRNLVESQGRLGRVRFVRLWADDQIIANQFVFAFGGRWFWELPSRIVGDSWGRFSLGSIAAVALLNEAMKEGVRRVEGGLGHYEYKLRLRAEEHATRVYRIVARRLTTQLRLWVFEALRLALLFGYHKIWYRRLSTHLPAWLGRSQWRLWLRFDC